MDRLYSDESEADHAWQQAEREQRARERTDRQIERAWRTRDNPNNDGTETEAQREARIESRQ